MPITLVSGLPYSGTSLVMQMLRAGGMTEVVEIACTLLRALPFDHDYEVIVIERDVGEVLASQAMMLQRRGEHARRLDAFTELLAALAYFRRWVELQPNFRCLWLEYRRVLDAPAEAADVIASFLDRPLDRAAMSAAIDPGLHRNRLLALGLAQP